MPITTVPACKAFRGIPGDNQEHDAELARLIQAVQEYLEGKCKRVFEQATITEYFNGDGRQDCVIVAGPPIVSVTNLWDDPLRVYATPLAVTSYVIDDAEAGIIRLDGVAFSKGLKNIKLTYVGGFATIPKDLEEAAIELVWAAREKGVNNLVGVRSRSVADGSVQYVNLGWGSLVDDIVSQYRLHTGVA
jgi:hypothetical protein